MNDWKGSSTKLSADEENVDEEWRKSFFFSSLWSYELDCEKEQKLVGKQLEDTDNSLQNDEFESCFVVDKYYMVKKWKQQYLQSNYHHQIKSHSQEEVINSLNN